MMKQDKIEDFVYNFVKTRISQIYVIQLIGVI